MRGNKELISVAWWRCHITWKQPGNAESIVRPLPKASANLNLNLLLSTQQPNAGWIGVSPTDLPLWEPGTAPCLPRHILIRIINHQSLQLLPKAASPLDFKAHSAEVTVCSQLETRMWLLRDGVSLPQMGKQRGSSQQMVGARKGNTRQPQSPFLSVAFAKNEKELLMTFRPGAVFEKWQCVPGSPHFKKALPDSCTLRGHSV